MQLIKNIRSLYLPKKDNEKEMMSIAGIIGGLRNTLYGYNKHFLSIKPDIHNMKKNNYDIVFIVWECYCLIYASIRANDEDKKS